MKVLLDIVVYVFSILGGIVAVYSLITKIRPYKRIRWKAVEKGVIKLRDKLIADNYWPTAIIGIGRGGAVIGGLVSGVLGHTRIVVLNRDYDWEEGIRSEKLYDEITRETNLDRVLLVAGELHTGGSAKACVKYLKSLGASEIRMYAFLKDKYPQFSPDYHTIGSNKPDIRLPWMLTKDYKKDAKYDYSKKD